MSEIPITKRAVRHQGTSVCTMPLAEHPGLRLGVVVHRLDIPTGGCPVSSNPLRGTLQVSYQPGTEVLEVVSLHAMVQQAFTEAGGLEEALIWLGIALRRTGVHGLHIALSAELRPGPQKIELSVQSA